MMLRLCVLLAVLVFAVPAFVWPANYYIDRVGGSDANTGLSTGQAWQNIRGMACVTPNSVAANHTPVAGNNYYFKGGVTWPNACLQWTWSWSGTAANRLYFGPDPTWYTGGAWTRPILNGNGAVVSGGANRFIYLSCNYCTLDNFEFTGALFKSGFPYGGTAYINPVLSHDLNILHNYFHGWVNGDNSDLGRMIISNSTNPSLNVNMVVAYNVFDGSDTAEVMADPNCTGACLGSGMAMYYGPIVHHNVMRYLSNGYIGVAQQFSNNLVEHIRQTILGPSGHPNAFENLGDPCATGTRMFGNVIHDTIAGVNIWLNPSGNAGCVPSYVWNNITYNTTAGSVMNLGGSATLGNPTGTTHVYNNTMQCGREGSSVVQACSTCLSTATCIYKNNHFMVLGNGSSAAVTGTNITEVTNLKQTVTAANAEGYTSAQLPYVYAPTDGADSTVGTGTNLTDSCGTLSSLCQDTTYAVSYDSTAHTVIVEGRTAFSRPGAGAWDKGAYAFANASPIPAAPTGQRLVNCSAIGCAFIWAPNTEANLAGYNVYCGSETGVYALAPVAANTPASAAATHSSITTYHLRRSKAGPQFCIVKAVNDQGTESAPSPEVNANFTGVVRGPRL